MAGNLGGKFASLHTQALSVLIHVALVIRSPLQGALFPMLSLILTALDLHACVITGPGAGGGGAGRAGSAKSAGNGGGQRGRAGSAQTAGNGGGQRGREAIPARAHCG